MKKVTVFLICFALFLSLFGCRSVLEGETEVIIPYVSPSSEKKTADEESVLLAGIPEFTDSVKAMLSAGDTYEAFRLPLTGRENLEEELPEICRELALTNPLGAYAVYYIDCEVTTVVSYYNVSVTVSYKRDVSDLNAISRVSSLRYLNTLLLSSLQNFDPVLTVYTSADSITQDAIRSSISSLYYENPMSVPILPEVELADYPASVGERITEISFTFPYSGNVMTSMLAQMNRAADSIVGSLEDEDEYSLLKALSETLSGMELISPAEGIPSSATAYSLLANRRGTDESFALAMKVLCDKLDIGCIVVNGVHNNEPHFWNIVHCNGQYYHIDCADLREDTLTMLRCDEEMEEDYSWNNELYPACPQSYPTEAEQFPETALPEE